MVVLQQARRAGRVLVDTPFLLAAAALPTLVGALQLAAQEVHPLANVAATGVGFFVSPFLVAGLLGSAAAALDGETPSWSRWLAWGRRRYVALFLANLGFFAVAFALGIAVAILAFVVLFVGIGIGVGLGGASAVTFGVFTLLMVVLFLAFVLGVAVLFAYYTAAAVVGEEGPLDAIRGSVRLARGHPRTTFGYVVLNFLASTLLTLPAYVVVLQYVELPPDAPTFGLTSLPPSVLAGLGVLGFAGSTIATAFGSTLLVGVYRTLRDDRGSAVDEPVADSEIE